MQAVIAFNYPYTPQYYKSVPVLTAVFTLLPWSLLAKGSIDLGLASGDDASKGISWDNRSGWVACGEGLGALDGGARLSRLHTRRACCRCPPDPLAHAPSPPAPPPPLPSVRYCLDIKDPTQRDAAYNPQIYQVRKRGGEGGVRKRG